MKVDTRMNSNSEVEKYHRNWDIKISNIQKSNACEFEQVQKKKQIQYHPLHQTQQSKVFPRASPTFLFPSSSRKGRTHRLIPI